MSLAVVLLLLLLWYAADLFLLAFLSILVAIFLRSLSDPLADRTGMPVRVSLWIVIVLIVGGIYLAGYLFSDNVGTQLEDLSDQLPKAFSQFQQSVQRFSYGRKIVQEVSKVEQILKQPGVLSGATGLLSATFGFLSAIVVMLVAGVFFASDPRLYVAGTVCLVRPQKRKRMRDVLDSLHSTMRWWIIGKSVEMIFIGIVTGVGLQLLGVQLALVLGIIAGLFAFIPYIGPLISALPAVLLTLVDDPGNALYVVGLYIAIQAIEGNVVTPIIEKKTVSLPPALTLFSQLLAALFFGFIGVLLASPMTAVAMVLVKKLYIEDILENSESGIVTPTGTDLVQQ